MRNFLEIDWQNPVINYTSVLNVSFFLSLSVYPVQIPLKKPPSSWHDLWVQLPAFDSQRVIWELHKSGLNFHLYWHFQKLLACDVSCNFHVFQHLSQGNFSLGFVGVGGDGRLILFLFTFWGLHWKLEWWEVSSRIGGLLSNRPRSSRITLHRVNLLWLAFLGCEFRWNDRKVFTKLFVLMPAGSPLLLLFCFSFPLLLKPNSLWWEAAPGWNSFDFRGFLCAYCVLED